MPPVEPPFSYCVSASLVGLARIVTALILLTLIASLAHASVLQQYHAKPNAGLELRPLDGSEDEQQSRFPGLLTENHITASVAGPVVHLSVRQSFRNTTRFYTEGLYRFPLPDDSSIGSMKLLVGSRIIEGEVQEKAIAEKRYQAAIKAGKRAAMLTEHRPNIFSTLIGNIAPGETLTVEITLVTLAEMDGVQLTWRLPQAITPRYVGPQSTGGPDTTSETDKLFLGSLAFYESDEDKAEAAQAAVKPARFEAQFSGADDITGVSLASQQGRTERYGADLVLSPASGRLDPTQDLVMRWHLRQTAEPGLVTYSETGEDGTRYSLGLLVPPRTVSRVDARPRDLIIILDTSSSMTGPSIAQAKTAVHQAVAQLRPGDRFDIIEFNSAHASLFGGWTHASEDALSRAAAWISALNARGGTNMGPAIDEALAGYASEDERLAQVVFITDGAVGAESALFEQVNRLIGAKRLFTVGVGPAPNGWFMRKAAEFGRGMALSIADPNDVAGDMQAFMDALARPALTDITAEGPEILPDRIGDLYGDRVKMLLWQEDTETAPLRLTARGNSGQPWRTTAEKDTTNTPGVRQYWARRQIEQLMDQMAVQRLSPAEDSPLRRQMVALSVTHQVLSPATRFIAVDKTPVRPESDALKQALQKGQLPKGTTLRQFAAPAGALGLGWHALWAILALALLALLYGGRLTPRLGRRP